MDSISHCNAKKNSNNTNSNNTNSRVRNWRLFTVLRLVAPLLDKVKDVVNMRVVCKDWKWVVARLASTQ